MDLNDNDGYRFICCSKCTTLAGDADSVSRAGHMENLHLPLNSAMNQKPPPKHKVLNKEKPSDLAFSGPKKFSDPLPSK